MPKIEFWPMVRLEIVGRRVTEDKAYSASSFQKSKTTPNERKKRGDKSEEAKNESPKTTGRPSRKQKFAICDHE